MVRVVDCITEESRFDSISFQMFSLSLGIWWYGKLRTCLTLIECCLRTQIPCTKVPVETLLTDKFGGFQAKLKA